MTAPHPIADPSQTTQFMANKVRQHEAEHGRAPTDREEFQFYRDWDDLKDARRRKDDEYKDARFMRRIKIFAGSITTIGASLFGVWVMFGGEDVQASDVQEAVVEASDHVDERIDRNADAIEVNAENTRTSVELGLENQELTVQSTSHIRDLIIAGPKGAAKVDKPPALKKAEAAVEDRKRDREIGELLKKLPPPD